MGQYTVAKLICNDIVLCWLIKALLHFCGSRHLGNPLWEKDFSTSRGPRFTAKTDCDPLVCTHNNINNLYCLSTIRTGKPFFKGVFSQWARKRMFLLVFINVSWLLFSHARNQEECTKNIQVSCQVNKLFFFFNSVFVMFWNFALSIRDFTMRLV